MRLLVFCLAFLLSSISAVDATAPPAGADEGTDVVILRNGDRLSGTIRHLSATRLALKTKYAGELGIPREQIASFSTSKPVPWLDGPDNPIQRAVFATTEEPGFIVVDSGEGPVPMPMDQVALLKPRPEETMDGIARSGRVSAASAWSTGNDRVRRIQGDGVYTVRARDWRREVDGSFRYERSDEQTTVEQERANASFDRFFGPRRFGYVRGSVERDPHVDLRLRMLAGAGLGHQLVDRPRTTVSVRAGLAAVHDDRVLRSRSRYPAAAWGVEAKHRLAAWDAELFHDQKGFWNLREGREVNLRSRTGLRMPVHGGVIASLQLNLDVDKQPGDTRRPLDATWQLGLGYAW